MHCQFREQPHPILHVFPTETTTSTFCTEHATTNSRLNIKSDSDDNHRIKKHHARMILVYQFREHSRLSQRALRSKLRTPPLNNINMTLSRLNIAHHPYDISRFTNTGFASYRLALFLEQSHNVKYVFTKTSRIPLCT